MRLLLLLLLSLALSCSSAADDPTVEDPAPPDHAATDGAPGDTADDPVVDDPVPDDPGTTADDPVLDDPIATGDATTGDDPPDDPPWDPADGIPPVDLAVPENGFQVTTKGRWIKPGTDVEFCEVVQLPGGPDDVYEARRLEVAMHKFSHHVIIKAAIPGSATESLMEPGTQVPCIRPQDPFGEDMVDVFGAQQPYHEVIFPEKVGRVFYGGQKLVFDFHYYNPTLEEIPARHALNFHLAEEGEIEHIISTFGFYNFTFLVMPGQTASTAAQCTFDDDVMLWSLTRHTHQWGKNFHVWWSGGDNDGEHIWTSEDWEHDVDYVLPDGPILVPKGVGLRFQCEFDNTSDHLLTFGVSASDEMCILFGMVWSPDGLTVPDQSCTASPATSEDL